MKDWEDLDYAVRMTLLLQAREDPVFFAENEYFLGLSLWPMQKEILRRFVWGVPKQYTIEEWTKLRHDYILRNNIADFNSSYVQRYNDLVIMAGMNSSKTFIASLLGLQQAFEVLVLEDPVKYYGAGSGTEFFVLNVATSDEQAHDTVYAQEKGKIDNSPYFQWMKPQERYNEFRFNSKNLIIRCGGSNSSSLVGRAVKCAIFDELARFKDTAGERSGWAVYQGLGRGTKKVSSLEAKRVAISSTLYIGDFIDVLYERSHRVPTMLGYKYATWEMNPNLTQEVLADDFDADPESAWRDYGVQPSRDIEKYYPNPEIIKFSSRPDPISRDGRIADWLIGDARYEYVLAGDPAIRMDSFGLALGHLQDGKVVIDLMHKIAPKVEIDPSEVVYFIETITARFGVRKFIIDQWNYPETLAKIREMGIPIEFHVVKKPEHDKFKEAWILDQVDCYENDVLKDELLNLELHKGTRVDHPRKGSKDLADAVTQVVWSLLGTATTPKPFQIPYHRQIIVKAPLIRSF